MQGKNRFLTRIPNAVLAVTGRGIEEAVYRDIDDPKMVLMVWDADSTDDFMEMLGSEELHNKMKEAGVVSGLDTWFGEKQE